DIAPGHHYVQTSGCAHPPPRGEIGPARSVRHQDRGFGNSLEIRSPCLVRAMTQRAWLSSLFFFLVLRSRYSGPTAVTSMAKHVPTRSSCLQGALARTWSRNWARPSISSPYGWPSIRSIPTIRFDSMATRSKRSLIRVCRVTSPAQPRGVNMVWSPVRGLVMIGNGEKEEASPSDLGHTRRGSDLDGTGPVSRSGW